MSAVFMRGNGILIWVPSGRGPRGVEELTFPVPEPYVCGVVVGDLPLNVRSWIDRGCTFVAHNAEVFDAPAWARFGYGDPTWCDTAHFCRAGGLPAGLDRACKSLGIEGKDEEGKTALRLLYTARVVGGKFDYPVGTVLLWRQMLAYNLQDVLSLSVLFACVSHYGEADVMTTSAEVNSRGVRICLPLARKLRDLWAESQKQAADSVEELTEGEVMGTDIRSVPKVKKWLASKGLVVKSLDRKALEQLMSDPDGYFGDTENPAVETVKAVILDRQQACRATAGKVSRVFDVVESDGRVRNLFVYHAAITGRYSSRVLQVHNMARGVGKLDVEKLVGMVDTLTLGDVEVEASKAGCSVGDALATLMRPVLCAEDGHALAPCDFGAIESRGTAWVAGCERLLSIFRDPEGDPYLDMAKRIFGPAYTASKEQRQVGKVCVLGCGYGMGAVKFGVSAKLMGADLAKAGVTPEQCVSAYREAYAEIPAVWKAYDRAAMDAVRGRPGCAGRCYFGMEGDTLCVTLPSGRALRYRHARIEKMPPRWNPTGRAVDTLLYQSPHGYAKVLYGGLLTENIVQAISRDLLCAAMQGVRIAGWPIVLHVHDEIVPEVASRFGRRCLEQTARVMSVAPSWAPGFPILVEGFTCQHYVKSPWSDSIKVKAFNGELL